MDEGPSEELFMDLSYGVTCRRTKHKKAALSHFSISMTCAPEKPSIVYRFIACYNPLLAEERGRKRLEVLADEAIEKDDAALQALYLAKGLSPGRVDGNQARRDRPFGAGVRLAIEAARSPDGEGKQPAFGPSDQPEA